MRKSAQYKILPELKVTIEYLSGGFGLEDMIAHRKLMMDDLEYNAGYNSITDFRDVVFNAQREDVVDYAKFTKASPKLIGKRKASILANTPQQTLITTLYNLNTQDLPFVIEIFYTLDAALDWIDVSAKDKEKVEGILAGMQMKLLE